MLGRLNGRLSWIQLGWVRQSFLSKALAAVGLAAGVITGGADAVKDAGFGPQVAGAVFWGSIVFLAGYLLFALRVPVEFRRSGEIDEIVGRMVGLSNWLFFTSRRTLAERLLGNERQRLPVWRAPEEAMQYLQGRLTAAEALREADAWDKLAPSLYQADLNLRQFARPASRFLVAALFFAGALLVILPALLKIASAAGIKLGA